MRRHPPIRLQYVIRIFLNCGLCCGLALIPLPTIAQFPGQPSDPQKIHGKIPASILQKLRTVHPGTTRAEFSKLFDYYAPGLSAFGYVKAGKSKQVYHYVYRLAYVPQRMALRKRIAHSKVTTELDSDPDTTHWVLKNPGPTSDKLIPAPISGTLIEIDVTWKFSRSTSKVDLMHSNDTIGNPDDVITRVSNPYLIYDMGIHG